MALIATAVAFFTLQAHVSHVEERALREEAQAGARAFDAVAQDIESLAAGAGAIATAVDGDPRSFETVLAPRLRTSFASSLALLRLTGLELEVIAQAGRREAALLQGARPETDIQLREAADSTRLRLVELTGDGEATMIGFAAGASTDSPYVVYVELLLPEVLALASEPAEDGIHYALYVGPESFETLAVSNTRELPITGRRVTETLSLGSESPLLVYATDRSLSGAFTTALPWAALGLGLGLAAILAALVEAATRRSSRAKGLVTDLEYATFQLSDTQEHYRALFENASDLVFITDLDGTFRAVNPAAKDLLGYEIDEVRGRRFEDMLAPGSVERASEARQAKLAGEADATTYDVEMLNAHGDPVQLEVTSRAIYEAGEAVGIQGIGRDVRKRRRLEERFRSLVQNSFDVIAVVTADRNITYISPSVERLLGYEADELIGNSVLDLFDTRDAVDVHGFLSALPPGETADLPRMRVRTQADAVRDVEIVARNLLRDQAVAGIVLTVRDVTERLELETQLAYQAFHDPLTGLANRALFMDGVDHALDGVKRLGHAVGVLLMDVDDFKTVNDSLGHEAGDRLLVAIADRLKDHARAADTCARLGGDEFALLLPGVDSPQKALEGARRLRLALSRPITVDGRDITVQLSIGIALASDLRTTTEELLRRADAAMYTAKRERLGGVRLYEDAMRRVALARLELKGELERALADDEFVVMYQPIVGLGTCDVYAVEALARWDHPTRGLLTPDVFIELAEETGLIVPLGLVVRSAAAEMHAELPAGPDGARPLVTVNVAPRELEEPDFAVDLADCLSDAGVDPSAVVLEITERALVRDADAVALKLEELRRLGVQIAVDDFGTGYSSLSALQRLPVDILKIAKPFVDDLGRGASIAGPIVRMGSTLGLDTVAEGIESEEQFACLAELGCDYGQGFCIAAPMPADELVEFLRVGARARSSAVA
jgi:diguanylate cyclase (GGDEF)-like protein/PAS domain S-box-containing protein